MAVITTAQFKTYAGITVTTWDTLLGVLIPACQAEVESYCNRLFDTATYTETFDGDNSGQLQLSNYPITSITSVSYVGPDGTTVAMPSTSYRYEANTGLLTLVPVSYSKSTAYDTMGNPLNEWTYGPRYNRGFQNYRVVYVGGYSSMPADLQLAMYEYVASKFNPIKNGATADTNLLSESIGDYSYTRKDDTQLGDNVTRLFRTWRRAIA